MPKLRMGRKTVVKPFMLRPVQIARWRNDSAAILSGVKDGELIATAGVHKLEAGQKVKPVQQAAR